MVLFFSWLVTTSAMSKVTVAVTTDVSACILRVQKTTTTNTGVKLSAISANIWITTLQWSNQRLGMRLPMTTFHVKCERIIKNLLRQQKLSLHVVCITSTFTSWHWCLASEHGNGYILIPALVLVNRARLQETFTCTIKEVYISCFVLPSNDISGCIHVSKYIQVSVI